MTKNLKADPRVMGPHTHEAHDSERQNNPIGVFDSGVGGLTVVSELFCQIPRERVVYFGDTAHLPYGTKSAETILAFSKKNVKLLLRYNVKLIIVACHSASSRATCNTPSTGDRTSSVRKPSPKRRSPAWPTNTPAA